MNRNKKNKAAGTVFALCVLVAMFFPRVLLAQNVEVNATLSPQIAAVGESVELTISVTGGNARHAKIPDNFVLDGLPIVSRGQSTQVNVINFQMTTTLNYTYLLRPEREGSFTIPSLAIEVGGKTYPTRPLQLEVRGMAKVTPGGGGRAQGQQQGLPGQQRQRNPRQQQQAGGQQQVSVDQIAKMEVVLPQKEVYVGQMVPVEVKAYFDMRFHFELSQMPVFSGEGFVAEKLSEPEERRETINGVPFQVVTFRSAITPVKSGDLVVSPAELACSVVLSGPNRMGSFFDDFFGGDPFGGMMGERRELSVKSNEISLKVKNLPKEGKPVDFSGAIGQFTLSQRMDPARAEVGEPMKLIADLRGQGNFGAVVQPALEGTDGWRTYSGGDKFTANDPIGFSGSKVFDITVMPMQEVRESPVAVFSYFDPAKAKYVTLRGDAQPVLIRGGKAPATPPKQQTANPATPTPAPQATPTPQTADTGDAGTKQEVQPQSVPIIGSFQAFPLRIEYLIANGAALVALLGFAGLVFAKRKQAGRYGKIAKLQKEQTRVLQALSSPGISGREFFEKAAEFIFRQQRIAANDPELVGDENSLANDSRLTPELRAEIARVFSWNSELKFSSKAQEPNAGQREATQAALQALSKQLK